MAVGVGVVVSAFRLTPFFCREKPIHAYYLRSTSLKTSPFPKTFSYPYLGKRLGWRSCRDSKEWRASRVQGLEKGRRDDGWMGNIEDSGGDLWWWSIQGCVRHRRDCRNLMSSGDIALERWKKKGGGVSEGNF